MAITALPRTERPDGVEDGPGAPDGRLLYIKATLSGDEPVDVKNFAALHPAFPHDPTGNQFFDEDRFESYRALGYHSVMSAAGELVDADAWDLCAGVARASPPGPPGSDLDFSTATQP
jgi:hypothetical protein